MLYTLIVEITLHLGENGKLCQPGGMEKITFLDENGTDVVFKKEEDDIAQSEYKIAEPHYFEVHLAEGKEFCIKLESERSQIIYHNPSAILHNAKKRPFTRG